MRSLELNLASRPFRNNTLLWLGYSLLAAAVVTFTAWNTVTFVEKGRTLDQLRNTVGSVESRLNSVDQRERSVEGRIGKHDVRYLATQTMRANEVIHRKAFSWTGLFNVLEDVQPYEVKMSSIRPIFGGDRGSAPALASSTGPHAIPVSVDGVAKSVQAFFDFEDALIRDRHIDRLEPMRSTRTKSGEILFALSFLYYPEGLDKKDEPAEGSAAHNAQILEEDDAGETPDGAAEAAGANAHAQEPAVVPPPATPPPAAQPAAAQLPGGVVRTQPRQVPPPKPRADPAPAPSVDPSLSDNAEDVDPAGRPLFKVGERRPLPEGPIRPRPKDFQPPDPFKDKKKDDPPAKKEGDR